MLELESSSVSIAPPPVCPLPGFLLVQVQLPKELRSVLATPGAREEHINRMANQIKFPMEGTVLAVGAGEDRDPMDKRRKPLPAQEGDVTCLPGDHVLFRPTGCYRLDLQERKDLVLVGDQDILAVVK